MTTPNISPCPACGKRIVISNWANDYHVYCKNCDVAFTFPKVTLKKEIVQVWNTYCNKIGKYK